ncbi:MAG: flagellar biosynthetic protein FliR [Polyangiales bacterium]
MIDLAHELVPFALTTTLSFSRVAGFVVTSPFPGRQVAATQRVGLALVVAWVAGMIVPAPTWAPGLDARTVGAAVSELAVGLTLGAAFRVVFSGAEVLSQNIAQASGLAAPSVFNPTLETQESAIGEAITLFAMLVALSMGAHRVALGWLLESFRALPVGATAHFDATTGAFVDLAAAALTVGLRLALPVVAVALATQVALAMIARAAPALQLFNIGLAVLIAAGATVLMASLGDVTVGLGGHFATLSPSLDRVLSELAAP